MGVFAIKNIPGYQDDEFLSMTQWFWSQSKEDQKKLYMRTYSDEGKSFYRGIHPFNPLNPDHHLEVYHMGVDFETLSPAE